jgi:hypothetical protein
MESGKLKMENEQLSANKSKFQMYQSVMSTSELYF